MAATMTLTITKTEPAGCVFFISHSTEIRRSTHRFAGVYHPGYLLFRTQITRISRIPWMINELSWKLIMFLRSSLIIRRSTNLLSTEFRHELKHDVACFTRDCTTQTKRFYRVVSCWRILSTWITMNGPQIIMNAIIYGYLRVIYGHLC